MSTMATDELWNSSWRNETSRKSRSIYWQAGRQRLDLYSPAQAFFEAIGVVPRQSIAIVRYVHNLLEGLTRCEDEDDLALKERTLNIIRRISDDRSVFPSISRDDDGDFVLYWRAGKQSIEVDLGTEGSYFVSIRSAAGEKQFEVEDEGVPPLATLRTALAEYSRVVESQNPKWRLLFES